MVFKHSTHGDRPLFLIDFDYAMRFGATTQYPKGTVSDIELYDRFSVYTKQCITTGDVTVCVNGGIAAGCST